MSINALQASPEHFILEVVDARLTLEQSKSWVSRDTSIIHVEASVGKTMQRTNERKFNLRVPEDSQVWNEELPFSLSGASSLTFKVVRKSTFNTHIIHTNSIKLDEKLHEAQASEQKRVPIPIRFSGSTFNLVLKASDAKQNTRLAVENLERDIKTEFGSKAGDKIKSFVDLAEEGEGLIQSKLAGALVDAIPILDTIVKAGDAVFEAHSILKVAWFAASALYKIVSDQVKFDQGVRDLVADLAKAFSFIRDVEGIRNKLDSLKESIEELLVLVTLCSLCIRKYARQSFVRRIVGMIPKDEITKFKDDLVELPKELDRRMNVNAAVAIDRVEIAVNRGDMCQQLQELKARLNPAESEDLSNSPRCMEGTRVQIRKKIHNWAKSITTQNILWLDGVVGSGKSTIATTIISELSGDSRLGAYFLFVRGKSDPDTVVQSIAYSLADIFPALIPHISKAIEGKHVNALDQKQRFDSFLKDPLENVKAGFKNPIIIVLDALEQCGTESSRKQLMELLETDFPKLPPVFRFLITSRPETDVTKALIQPSVLHVKLDHSSDESRSDVERYIEAVMRHAIYGPVPLNWLTTLSDASDGLFVFASVAVKIVESSEDFDDVGPCEKLKGLVDDVSAVSHEDGIDGLYRRVLENLKLGKKGAALFSKIFGIILLGRISLSEADIDDVLGLNTGTTNRSLQKLQSILIYDAGGHVSPFHASFTDYLLAHEKRSANPWFINVTANDAWLTPRCFDLMSELNPNICSLDSPLKVNSEVDNLETRIQNNIPLRLRYACLHWAQHLRGIPAPSDLSSKLLLKLKTFLHEKLLCWFEVLSVTNEFSRFAGPSLLEAIKWIPVKEKNSEIKMLAFLRDARRLAHTFAAPISQSAPHIYLSMLPFSQGESVVADHYFEQTHHVVQVKRIGIKKPSPLLNELKINAIGYVHCLSFSPDAKYIAAGCNDGTVRLLDAETGEVVSKSFEGSEGHNCSIAFSPVDGRYLVCGNGHGIRVWEVNTGEIVLDLPEAYADDISSVAFCRYKDGTLIVGSGSLDGTVKVWDAETGILKFGPLKGADSRIFSVAFSPDGSAIASSYEDRDVVVWDLRSNGRDYETLPMRHGAYCIVFSHGSQLACGSDGEIVVWKDENGTRVPTTLKGRNGVVWSIAFSPDDQFIASGSYYDRHVLLWDVKSGQIVSSFMGHTAGVYSVDYSPDGTRIVSAIHNTIMIWDAEARVTDPEPEPAGYEGIQKVAINANSDILAVSSNNMKIWNTDGVLVAVKPFEEHMQSTFSHDGRHLVRAGYGIDRLSVWDTETDPLKLASPSIRISRDRIGCIGVSDDSTLFAVGSYDGDVRVYPSDLRFFDDRSERRSPITAISSSSDNRHIASGVENGTVHLLDIHDGKEVFSWSFSEGKDARIDSIAFSRDGTKIAVGYSVRHVGASYLSIIDVESKRIEVDHVQHHSESITALDFSPDGKSVVSCSFDKTVVVCNASTGETNIGPLTGHSGWVNSVKFLPDGQRVVTGSGDGTVRVWDVEKPMLLSAPFDNPGDSRWKRRFKDCVGALTWWKLGDDGWIRDDKKQLLVWVPPDSRFTLLRPQNTAILNRGFSTRLTFISEAGH